MKAPINCKLCKRPVRDYTLQERKDRGCTPVDQAYPSEGNTVICGYCAATTRK